MADEFVFDTDKAEQLSRRLQTVAQASDGAPARPNSPGGSLGTGSLESALSQWDSIFGAFKQDHTQKVKGSSDAFSMTSSDVTANDESLAQQAEGISGSN
jgi:hypothetical protein